ncbi:MAG: class I SAM-dependent methyltransferase [Elusimicrobia bacterium]|nr:class I SAM-dependent methyltransferase [Elusimicrobiota bacterium]
MISLGRAILVFLTVGVPPIFAAPPKPEDVLFQTDFTMDVAEGERLHTEFARFKELMDALVTKPGMTVLDVGTGSGQYAYEFARRLGSTGEVFATDIQEKALRHVEAEAKRRGYSNLRPVLVSSKGIDPFYLRHRYDIVLMSNVYQYLDDRVNFIRRLRERLNPGGKLVFLTARLPVPVTAAEIPDPSAIERELSKDPPGSPYRRYYEKPGKEGEALDAAARINRIVFSDDFYKDFLTPDGRSFKPEYAFRPVQKKVAEWLLLFIRSSYKDPQPRSPHYDSLIHRLNEILVQRRFAAHLKRAKAPQARLPEFESAGYRLDSEFDYSPTDIVDIFVDAGGR